MQSCNTPCTGTEYPIHMGTVPLKEEEEDNTVTSTDLNCVHQYYN